MRKMVLLIMTLGLLLTGILTGFNSAFAESTKLTEQTESQKWLEQIKERSPQGILPGCDFPIQSNITDIAAEWGAPNYKLIHKYTYAAVYGYSKKGIEFSTTRFGEVFFINLLLPNSNVTQSEVKTALGEPTATEELTKDDDGNDVTVDMYTIGKYPLFVVYTRSTPHTIRKIRLIDLELLESSDPLYSLKLRF